MGIRRLLGLTYQLNEPRIKEINLQVEIVNEISERTDCSIFARDQLRRAGFRSFEFNDLTLPINGFLKKRREYNTCVVIINY